MTKLRRYYAATLKGDDPAAIDKVYMFTFPSQRKQWLTETEYPFGIRVEIPAKIAKLHEHIEVHFRSSNKFGKTVWTWTYNNQPDWLLPR